MASPEVFCQMRTAPAPPMRNFNINLTSPHSPHAPVNSRNGGRPSSVFFRRQCPTRIQFNGVIAVDSDSTQRRAVITRGHQSWAANDGAASALSAPLHNGRLAVRPLDVRSRIAAGIPWEHGSPTSQRSARGCVFFRDVCFTSLSHYSHRGVWCGAVGGFRAAGSL
jgi:hypothetical protein